MAMEQNIKHEIFLAALDGGQPLSDITGLGAFCWMLNSEGLLYASSARVSHHIFSARL